MISKRGSEIVNFATGVLGGGPIVYGVIHDSWRVAVVGLSVYLMAILAVVVTSGESEDG